MFVTEWFSTISSFLAKNLLVQVSPGLMFAFAAMAIMLLMLRISKPKPSIIVKVIAITLLIWVSANSGWWLRDGGWGVDEVNRGRQKQIDFLEYKIDGN